MKSEYTFAAFGSILFLGINVCLSESVTSYKLKKQQQRIAFEESDEDYSFQKEHVLEKEYHGLIRENETIVELTPLIKFDAEKVCGINIISKPFHDIPFEIEILNNMGILKSKRVLNCEKRKTYNFEIAAVFCDRTYSATAEMHIAVIDINEYAPTFSQPSYVTEVDEGRFYKEIIRLEAKDKDCTPLYGDVCHFKIENNDQPFIIDNEGSIKNTEPLFHKFSHNHILSVVAYDCAMKQSAPVMVSIKVRRVCEAKFLGIPERIDYTVSSSETLILFPNIKLELCEMKCASNLNIRTSVTLKTSYPAIGCDRDFEKCSNKFSLVDLLPITVNWTKNIMNNIDSETLFKFDGFTGVVVPKTIVAEQEFSARPLSIVTVFRHFCPSTTNKHTKEHIVCSADDHKMNRHHMALFVRNYRLIFLMRKNFKEGDLNIFSPAEWRWKIPHVCDGEWHQYVINVDVSSKVELYIDGSRFESSMHHHNNPEVIDDWPLHAALGINTTLAVGACYQGSENLMKHGFKGEIREIKFSLDNIFSEDDIKCMNDCAERMLLPLKTKQVYSNLHSNEIIVEGQNEQEISNLLRKLQYINTKSKPTSGRRNVEIRSTMTCLNQSAVRLPTVETFLMVNEPNSVSTSDGYYNNKRIDTLNTTTSLASFENRSKIYEKKSSSLQKNKTTIKISGNNENVVTYPEIKRGIPIFSNINISINFSATVSQSFQFLDSCNIIVFPSLNPDHEEIRLDNDAFLSSNSNSKTVINKDGVEVVGYDSTINYLAILKSLVYSNKKPAYYLNRVFKLYCLQNTWKSQSEDFTITITVLHPKQHDSFLNSTEHHTKELQRPEMERNIYLNSNLNILKHNIGEKATSPNKFTENLDQADESEQRRHSILYDKGLYSNMKIYQPTTFEAKSKLHSLVNRVENYHTTILVTVACIFIIVIVTVAFVRKRNSKLQCSRSPYSCDKVDTNSLTWDDSSLKITINPIQAFVVSGDSSESDRFDSDDDDVDCAFTSMNQLEWDNSNIFSTTNTDEEKEFMP